MECSDASQSRACKKWVRRYRGRVRLRERERAEPDFDSGAIIILGGGLLSFEKRSH